MKTNHLIVTMAFAIISVRCGNPVQQSAIPIASSSASGIGAGGGISGGSGGGGYSYSYGNICFAKATVSGATDSYIINCGVTDAATCIAADSNVSSSNPSAQVVVFFLDSSQIPNAYHVCAQAAPSPVADPDGFENFLDESERILDQYIATNAVKPIQTRP